MSEPSLESMSDYDSLTGEKRRVVWAVIIAGLLMGTIYVTVDYFYGNVDDSLKVEDSVKYAPLK